MHGQSTAHTSQQRPRARVQIQAKLQNPRSMTSSAKLLGQPKVFHQWHLPLPVFKEEQLSARVCRMLKARGRAAPSQRKDLCEDKKLN